MTKKRGPVEPKQLTRKQLSRREQEQRYARRVVIGTAAALGLALLILAWGLIQLYAVAPRKPVATVSGVPIRLSTYQKLLKYRRYDYHSYINNLKAQRQQYAASGEDATFMLDLIDQQLSYLESQVATLHSSVLEELIEDQVTRQECALRGIVVTEAEVERELERQFGYQSSAPTPETSSTPTPLAAGTPTSPEPPAAEQTEPTPTPTATLTYDEYTTRSREWLANLRRESGFGAKDYRRLLESSLYRQKLEQAIGSEVPLTAEQVHALQILVATQAEADAVLARLAEGEDWGTLAAELSLDEATKGQGGDMGWFSRGKHGDAFDEVVFAQQPDLTKSVVVQDDAGFHVVRVVERDPARYLPEEDLQAARQKAVTDWFSARTSSENVVRLLDYATMVPPDPFATH